jgi:hypothetical protein
LNSDQLLVFLGNKNFIAGQARKEKVIEALHMLYRTRSLKIYKERPEL